MKNSKITSDISFPTFPSVVIELLKYTSKEDASVAGIEDIIKKDPGLTAEILRVANSPLYGKGRISSVRHALTFLGLNTLKYIAISVAVTGIFSKREILGKQTGMDFAEFWTHSLRIATISHLLARKIKYQDPEGAFVAGLLHDLGRLVLVQYFPEEYRKVVEKIKEEQVKSYVKFEKQILGVTHTEIGAELFHFWNFPIFLIEAARKHHLPLEQLEETIIQIVHIAHLIDAVHVLSPHHQPFGLESLCNQLHSFWNLSQSDLEEILAVTEAKLILTANSLGIPIAKKGNKSMEFKKEILTAQSETLGKWLIFRDIWKDLEGNSINEIFLHAAKAFVLGFKIKKFLFFIVNKKNNSLEEIIVEEFHQKSLPLTIPLDNSQDAVIECLRQKRILFYHELEKHGFTVLQEIKKFFGNNFIILPLPYGEERCGVILLEKMLNSQQAIDLVLNPIADQIAAKLKIAFLTEEKLKLWEEKEQLKTAFEKNLDRLIKLEKKMAALETAGAAAHELNQSLTVIQARIELLLNKLQKQKTLGYSNASDLETVLNETQKMAEFINKMLQIRDYRTKKYLEEINILDIR
ncbi:MAG: HDOD domain-containing protein [Candidatus Desulfofervidaceae bacterium]|nr:HDOD domain-containing protein [Candidatus Desulfofervidaceae bacterium]